MEQKVSATYTPTVTPSTKYVDNKGNAIPGYPEVDGTVEKKDIPGYAYVGTKTDEKGNTTHIYEKSCNSSTNSNTKRTS